MPWFFRMMQLLTRQLVYPGLLIVFVCGIYLASRSISSPPSMCSGASSRSSSSARWRRGARVRKLIEVSERDLAAAPAAGSGPSSAVSFSADYRTVFNQLSIGGAAQALIVVRPR